MVSIAVRLARRTVAAVVRRYSTFVVKYAWCFLLLGSSICVGLGLAAVLMRDLPDFNDPTKVRNARRCSDQRVHFVAGLYSTR